MSLEAPEAHLEPSQNRNEHEGNDMQKEAFWEQAAGQIEAIRAKGGFSAFVAQHPELTQQLTEHACESVCCMDGRVAPFQNAIAVAGSGILIKDDPIARERFVSALKARGIKKLTSHDGCGALGLYAKAKEIDLEEAEKHMTAWLSELAEELGSTEQPERLSVTPDFHNETCAYIITTERFSFANTTELPTGFEITAPKDQPVVSEKDLFAQVEVALNIAFGDHGFGEKFTKETPFSVVVVAGTDEDLARIQTNPELLALVANYEDRAVIDGFVLAEETEALAA